MPTSQHNPEDTYSQSIDKGSVGSLTKHPQQQGFNQVYLGDLEKQRKQKEAMHKNSIENIKLIKQRSLTNVENLESQKRMA